MKSKRQQEILRLIAKYDIDTQEELRARLAENGFTATQATVSRDMRDLKIIKSSGADGKYKYVFHEPANDAKLQTRYAKVLREAVKAYDSGKGYQFTTYLHFHVMRAVRAQLPDSRIKEISGNESVKDDDSEGAALFDFIADDTAAVSFQSIEQREMRLIVRRAVAMLPKDSRICICLNFFENITQKQIAVITGYSESKVHAAIMRGLHTLYKNKALRALYY